MIGGKIINKLDRLLAEATHLKEEYDTKVGNNMQSRINGIERDHKIKFSSFRTSYLNFVEKIEGKNSKYYLDFEDNTNTYGQMAIDFSYNLLQNLKADIDDGWIGNIRNLISADIFTDFIEMADYLLEENYKDPAAVILGSVLEENLRNLCQNNGIPVEEIDKKGKMHPKKASAMNDELLKNSIYNNLTQKNVTAWLDLRNKAAHGKFSEYNIQDVRAMSLGMKNFIVSNN